jgi:hypothetical protein
MNKKEQVYRIYLTLSEPEAVALSRLGKIGFRDVRTQAHFLLRQKLIDLKMLPEEKIETVNQTNN